MIPPLQDLRLRSINQWLKDQHPTMSTAERSSRASELDDAMIQEFEDREDSLKEQRMKDRRWGTEESLTRFPLERMEIWQDVCQEFLPATTDQPRDLEPSSPMSHSMSAQANSLMSQEVV